MFYLSGFFHMLLLVQNLWLLLAYCAPINVSLTFRSVTCWLWCLCDKNCSDATARSGLFIKPLTHRS